MSRAKPWQKIFDKTSDSWQSYKNKIQEAYVGEIQSSNPELTALTKANNRRKQLLDAWLVPEFEDDELGPFEYEPLPELDQPVVRIVQILPGRDYEPIEVFLDTCTLDADYESLSYAWGDPSATSPITCNGKRFYATKNLKAALRDLRRPHTPRAMWVSSY